MQQENIEKLNSYWNALPRKVKQSEAVIFAYCQVLAENTIIEPIESLLLAPLKKDASALFLKKLRHLPLTHANSLMALVHKQLHKNPQSGKWLSTLAHLAFATNELTTSEKAFTSLLHLPEPVYDEIDLKVFAQVYQAEQKYVEANKVYQKLLTIQEHGK